jgi:transposase-like protein
MNETKQNPSLSVPTAADVTSAESIGADVRARPGRRTVEERQQAVLELFAGKATVDQIARRLGVHASTVEGWRQDALGGVEQALRRGSGKTTAELRAGAEDPRPREGRHDPLHPEVPARERARDRACEAPYGAREVQAMSRMTIAGEASVSLLCATFHLSRAAFYAEARRQRGESALVSTAEVVRLPRRPRYTVAAVVLERIREVLARDTARAWGVRKVWATLRREGLRVSRRRVHALMRAHDLCLARDREPGETPRGHVAVPESNREPVTSSGARGVRSSGAGSCIIARRRSRPFSASKRSIWSCVARIASSLVRSSSRSFMTDRDSQNQLTLTIPAACLLFIAPPTLPASSRSG